MKPITILLADDHQIVRQGFRQLLAAEPDLMVIGEAQNGRQAVELAAKLRPDVIVMDIAMPQLNGLEAARQILSAAPGTRLLMLSAHVDDAYVEQALAVGASGFLLKQASAKSFSDAIREIHKGNTTFSPAIVESFRDQDAPGRKGPALKKLAALSSREMEVLQLVAEGKSNKETAEELGIGIKTVEKHREHVMQKLKLRDTAGLTRYAISAGIIENSVQLTVV